MKPNLSQFGVKMSSLTGVRAIMKDINETLRQADQNLDLINLSAGNPVILPEVAQLWHDCTAQLLSSPDYSEVVCRYGGSKGYAPLIEAIQKDFQHRYNVSLSDRNILITPGSQSLYFFATNALAGYTNEGNLKKVILPLSPEYTGYGGISLFSETVTSYRPEIEILPLHRFKYRPDFTKLQIDETTGLVLFSRPCNPTGNVFSDEEVQKIANLAALHDVPVFVDSAYGPPFPALNFTEMNLLLGDNLVHCMSLSKAGLPGERIGIAIGEPAIIEILEAFQTNTCIHSSRYGQAIAARAIESGQLADISASTIRPYYYQKFEILEETLDKAMPDQLPWYLHKGEGAIFAWLWFDQLPITDWDLYQALKKVGVIVVPGSPFFPGLQEEWTHMKQCLRISLTASNEEIIRGMKSLAQVINQVYSAH